MLGRVRIEARDDGGELVDRAAEALAVLLDELRQLRHRQAEQGARRRRRCGGRSWASLRARDSTSLPSFQPRDQTGTVRSQALPPCVHEQQAVARPRSTPSPRSRRASRRGGGPASRRHRAGGTAAPSRPRSRSPASRTWGWKATHETLALRAATSRGGFRIGPSLSRNGQTTQESAPEEASQNPSADHDSERTLDG